mmetsp:Transcript_32020/g.48284  ORF Transcript_32020/g.48284 Transcript_32020/m.48284 type:complete len:158 (-) Transcript_32020:199-672(-)
MPRCRLGSLSFFAACLVLQLQGGWSTDVEEDQPAAFWTSKTGDVAIAAGEPVQVVKQSGFLAMTKSKVAEEEEKEKDQGAESTTDLDNNVQEDQAAAAEDAEATGMALEASSAGDDDDESAPERKLYCKGVGGVCWISAQCCSARCVATHKCGPQIR